MFTETIKQKISISKKWILKPQKVETGSRTSCGHWEVLRRWRPGALWSPSQSPERVVLDVVSDDDHDINPGGDGAHEALLLTLTMLPWDGNYPLSHFLKEGSKDGWREHATPIPRFKVIQLFYYQQHFQTQMQTTDCLSCRSDTNFTHTHNTHTHI